MDPKKPAPPSIYALLRRTGLSEKEIDVYLATLSYKSARASAIAMGAKQSRSTTYFLLQSLVEKGLVSEIEKGKVMHFVAEPPERLIRYTKSQERSLSETSLLLESAMPAFHSIQGPLLEEPKVTKFHGIEGMKQTYGDLLTREFCGIFNPEYSYQFFGMNIVTSLLGKGARLRGRDLLVESARAREYLQEVTPSDEYNVRLLPPYIAPTSDMMIAGNTIALLAYDRDITTVLIENQNLADGFRMWFEGLWNLSSSLN
jgi:hypothetical protein